MPFGAIQVRPGVNTIATPTLNSAGISTSNLVRFRQGLVEKVGGWLKYLASAMTSITRALHAWQDLNSNRWLAVANLNSLIVSTAGANQTLSPQFLITNPTVDITVVQGSTTASINDTQINNLTSYDAVYFNTPITIGGVILEGIYQVNSGTGTNYTINSGQIATSSVNNAGAVPAFTTVAGSSSVSVAFANHGLQVGGKFNFPISTIAGGITITGIVTVATVVDANTFTFTAAQQATASGTTSMNGGNAQYLYYVSVGPPGTTQSGAMGPIGQFAIGEGYARTSSINTQTGTPITAIDWTLDNWGEILLACPRGGPIFYWSPSSGFSTMIPIGSGPPQNNGIFVAMPQQILVAWGSASSLTPGNPSSSLDPLIVRWSTILDFTNWVVSSTTQAGSFRIPTGSKIMGAIQGPGSALIFTDIDVWSMNYLGFPLVFGFNQIYAGGGLVGPHARTSLRNSVFWMGSDNFYTSNGQSVQIIPCTVWDTVFQDLDTTSATKVVAAANTDFSEVWFFYPSTQDATGENSRYAKVNIAEGFVWDTGLIGRSAWVPRSVLGEPIGADPVTLNIYQHEISYSDNGAAMDSFFGTGYFPYGDGENFSVVDQFQPDMKFTTLDSSTPSANVNVTITTVNYPTDTVSMTNTSVMTSTTEYLSPRLRGRQMKWEVGTNDATSWWRQGLIRYRFNVDGRR